MGTILVIILILLLIGALPAWPYSSGWGYWPSGGLGLILLIATCNAYARPRARASLSRCLLRSEKFLLQNSAMVCKATRTGLPLATS